MAVDEERVEELIGQLAGHMTGAAICLTIWLGDELGLLPRAGGRGRADRRRGRHTHWLQPAAHA